jgi:DNA-binding Lrp family transcriptional regulator
MGEDRFEMSQKERDRLKVLHEAGKGQITQKQAAEQLRVTERQVRRLIKQIRDRGDVAVVHGLRGRASNRRIDSETERRAIEELRRANCHDFGPTFAAEHVSRLLGVKVGRDTMRKWMIAAGLWRSRKRKLERIHQWRERRACFGELVQWDTSTHDWLEGRGERLYLIAMIDDATSRVYARFVRRDTTEENMRMLWSWLEQYGRPLSFYTDKAAMFEVAVKKRTGKEEPPSVPPTQITRALNELGIERISAHSPQAKGRVERFFHTAQDRLVKQLRLAGACTAEAANACLDQEFLPDWQQRFTVAPANSTDAHRPLSELHDLAASLSHVETRTVTNHYTFPFDGKCYRIKRGRIEVGMRCQQVRVERRLDGSLAVRFRGGYLDIEVCPPDEQKPKPAAASKPVRKDHNRGGRSSWMRDYPVSSAEPLWKAIRESNRNR